MENKISVLIVEDEGIVALGLEDCLRVEGYDIAGVTDNGKDALEIAKSKSFDLILLDIQIRGDWDGIETARRLIAVRDVPFIYLTAFSDEGTVERARETYPAAYLTKPYQARNLAIAIDLALHNFAFRKSNHHHTIPPGADKQLQDRRESLLYFNDSVFFKQNYKYVKVRLEDIQYLEADGNYTNIHTSDKLHVIRYTLNTLLEKLDQPVFVRVHRSFAVNFNHITTFNDHTVYLGMKEISMGRHYKEEFFRRFDFL